MIQLLTTVDMWRDECRRIFSQHTEIFIATWNVPQEASKSFTKLVMPLRLKNASVLVGQLPKPETLAIFDSIGVKVYCVDGSHSKFIIGKTGATYEVILGSRNFHLSPQTHEASVLSDSQPLGKALVHYFRLWARESCRIKPDATYKRQSEVARELCNVGTKT